MNRAVTHGLNLSREYVKFQAVLVSTILAAISVKLGSDYFLMVPAKRVLLTDARNMLLMVSAKPAVNLSSPNSPVSVYQWVVPKSAPMANVPNAIISVGSSLQMMATVELLTVWSQMRDNA